MTESRGVWLEEAGGNRGARLNFLAEQGLRLLMADRGPEGRETLHFFNPREGKIPHLVSAEEGELLEAAGPFFPAAYRWIQLIYGGEEEHCLGRKAIEADGRGFGEEDDLRRGGSCPSGMMGKAAEENGGRKDGSDFSAREFRKGSRREIGEAGQVGKPGPGGRKAPCIAVVPDGGSVLDAGGGLLLERMGGKVLRVMECRREAPSIYLLGTKTGKDKESARGMRNDDAALCLAFIRALEDARGWSVPPSARAVRTAVLEMWRIGSHCCWLSRGAELSGRLRLARRLMEWEGLIADLEKLLTGGKGLPGMLVPGGIRVEVEEEARVAIWKEMESIEREPLNGNGRRSPGVFPRSPFPAGRKGGWPRFRGRGNRRVRKERGGESSVTRDRIGESPG